MMQSIIGYMRKDTKAIVGERLKELMNSVPALSTQQKLAARTGIGQTTIGRIRRGEVNATADNLKQIAAAFNVPMSYLYGETDEQERAPEGHRSNVGVFQPIGPDRIDRNVEAGPDVRGSLPLISWAQAGDWAAIADNFKVDDAEDWVLWPGNPGKHAFVLKVVGESMYDPSGPKSYAPGEFIAVDPAKEVSNRCMVVVRLDHEDKATFKQLLIGDDGIMMLKALNPSWPNRIQPMPQASKIIGVVIGTWRPE